MNKKQIEAAEKRLAELNQENFEIRDKLSPLDAAIGDLSSAISELTKQFDADIAELVKKKEAAVAELTGKRDAAVKERGDAASRRAAVKAEYGELFEDVGIAKKELARKEAK